MNWDESLQGATQDEITRRSRRHPFDKMSIEMKKSTKDLKNDLGTQYENKSMKGSVDTVLDFSKRMAQKTVQQRRRKSHFKMLRCTLMSNRTRKK